MTDTQPRVGFFTDTSVCIGCKACEVACKEWNDVPEDGLNFLTSSYDHTGELGANTWRHVAFIEQQVAAPEDGAAGVRVPDRGAVPDRVRDRRRAGGHLQRLRILHSGLPLRRDRSPRG
jgi:formate dehydrogenase iron-sulfur subunit